MRGRVTPLHKVRTNNMNIDNQKELINKLKSGDTASYTYLYNTFSKKIHTLAYKMTGNIDEADDITQETFISAFQNIENFKGQSQIYTWLYIIAKNICYRSLKNSNKSSFYLLEKLIHSSEEKAGYETSNALEKQFYISQVKEGCLTGLLKCLSIHQRIAFILHVLLKIPIAVTADIISKSQNSTKVLIHRARKNIKKFLCENCSLYDKKNSCRCENLINFSLTQGWINIPDKKDLNNVQSTDSDLIENEINDLKKITNLYHSLPEKKPDKNLIKNIQKIIQDKTLSILN
jgi:RNA polymerase sigma factor (sigma-70 family)